MEKTYFKIDNVQSHWATPVLICQLKKYSLLNKELTYIIKNNLEKSSEMTSNYGSWRSQDDLLKHECSATKILRDRIGDIIFRISDCVENFTTINNDIIIEAWANVYNDGDYQTPHIHHDSNWSGVYFVSSGDKHSVDSGLLILNDPRAFINKPIQYIIKPMPGLIVVFPSWLRHWVTPYNGKNPRISIAFNAKYI